MLEIKATRSSPEIMFYREKGILVIRGESYPENSFQFFAPVFQWLEKEFRELEKLEIHVNINYMNSSSTKCMLDILDILDEAYSRGADIKIMWFYDSANERALDLAEEFREDLGLDFEIIPRETGRLL